MRKVFILSAFVLTIIILFVQCNTTPTEPTGAVKENATKDYNGYESMEKWGEHIVLVSGCHDCHSPKVMTPMGPDIDSALMLGGHQAKTPRFNVPNIGEIQKNSLVLTDGSLTSWVGPWGTSFTANLTSDATGIGNWTEEQFFRALREGKYKGLANERNLLPPMPWQMYRHFKDEEIRAVFAYLKSTKPVSNVVPAPLLPGK